jgi:hypothetical protein
MNSRRDFLVTSSALLAGAAFPKALFAQRIGGEVFTNASLGAYTQGLLTQVNFEKVIGSVFTTFLDNGAAAYLLLRAVTASTTSVATASTTQQLTVSPRLTAVLPPRNPAAAAQQPTNFQLHFNITGPAFPQDTYLLDHGTLGRFAAFLVPGSTGKCTASFCYFQNAQPSNPVTIRVGTIFR